MSPYVADPVYLNGQFLPLAEAGISPLDRGFLYGDGVYELIPVYSRRAFRIDEHLHRLAGHAGWHQAGQSAPTSPAGKRSSKN